MLGEVKGGAEGGARSMCDGVGKLTEAAGKRKDKQEKGEAKDTKPDGGGGLQSGDSPSTDPKGGEETEGTVSTEEAAMLL